MTGHLRAGEALPRRPARGARRDRPRPRAARRDPPRAAAARRGARSDPRSRAPGDLRDGDAPPLSFFQPDPDEVTSLVVIESEAAFALFRGERAEAPPSSSEPGAARPRLSRCAPPTSSPPPTATTRSPRAAWRPSSRAAPRARGSSASASPDLAALLRIIGESGLHWKASANSGRLETGPLTRKRGGECGLFLTWSCVNSGRWFVHHACAKPRKNCCSGVKEAAGWGFCASSFFIAA